jgi:hypothetical protein
VSREYEAGYRDGSIHYELEHCSACKNVADLQEALADNVKLRELVRDMYGFIERTDEDCGDVTFSDCFDYCKHDTADDGCCKTGECWYERRMRELGVEVAE